jgi:hypothetical protein
VRTAIIPQPMSTPTAAGMIAPSVGMTDPTVAPLPRCASGISARYGWMNGIAAVRSACSRVLGSRMDAQLSRRPLICSTARSSLRRRSRPEGPDEGCAAGAVNPRDLPPHLLYPARTGSTTVLDGRRGTTETPEARARGKGWLRAYGQFPWGSAGGSGACSSGSSWSWR